MPEVIGWLLLGLVLVAGGVIAWLVMQAGALRGRVVAAQGEAKGHEQRAAEAEAAHERVRAEADRALAEERQRTEESGQRVLELSQQVAQLNERLTNAELLRQELEKNEARLRETFKALTGDALKASRAEFLEQAKPVFEAARKQQADLVKPIGEVLDATREKLEQIEKSRVESFARLTEKMDQVTGSSVGLREETARLTKALSRPEIRGQYGEIQLRRVAEIAGMTSYCDFTEQTSVRDDEGNLQRPDMVVTLPNDRVIVVDAKANIQEYIEAVNAGTDEAREEHLVKFARHVSDQAKKLASKKYWSQFDGSPEFVVMFVPGDHFIDAALSREPSLLEDAGERGVILASPSTLIGLLRAVAVGWREHSLTEQAGELFELGRQLHERAAIAFEKIQELGVHIGRSASKFDEVVGSIDSRLKPTLRKFEEAGAKSGKEIVEFKAVGGPTRRLEPGGE
jgi:DNA recombination protein RmuC